MDLEHQGCERMENRICALPDELLEQILFFVPTKDAIATTILSKRWRYVWTMLPELEFIGEYGESNGWFIEKSLQLHKAPKLKRLVVELGPQCPVDIDVGKWVEKAVNRCVVELGLNLLWTAEPTSFPKSLYTCKTLVNLTLSNNILVDVSSAASLPSLLLLDLHKVVYKDEDSLVMLLSSSPNLKSLTVDRREFDNLTNYTVRVPSLETLFYSSNWPSDEVDDDIGSLVVDSPSLKYLDIYDGREDYCLIENMPCLDDAAIGSVYIHDDKFLTSFSSVKHLYLFLNQALAECCGAIEFSRLIELHFHPNRPVDWLEPLVLLLQNSPKLKTLTIDTDCGSELPLSWNQPNSIPECLSSHLEIFRWNDYGGREEEKPLVTYMLANSKSLKTVEISLLSTCNLEEKQKEIESMPRISKSSLLLFPTHMKYMFKGKTYS